MEMQQQAAEDLWRRAIATGELGVWDLRFELETVHYSPQWKQRLGFPDPQAADSTHFWRCRVHPDDLDGMLAAMRAHARGEQLGYEARFRLRSNGSGYRVVHSHGRIIERGAAGRALRMVGTMVDLSASPLIPRGGLPEGPRGAMEGLPLTLPFHRLLGVDGCGDEVADGARIALERDRVLGLVGDLLHAAAAHLAGPR
ncbi:PAS domain-containing protein [Pelomonas aquatica]|jgi:hypothetical protein|uniref:PAS fold-3 domain-containing protein n=1 Tax=Pelomonas aquatica TaxID=431058 RepID=A0A9X4LFH6_9BURK|nr:PAS domain-containing protein [Pelomonas aquatica]MCY4755598.1 PAS domain-containing protein [Pelomonas aquatica]MDG0862188.1 hypothetical protein [Pelomonas aquatica]